MDSHELLLDDISRNNVDHFDERDNANPDIEPYRDIQNWNQFKQTHDDKDNVRNRIQLGTKHTDSVRFSSDPTVNHVGQSGGDV